MKVKTIWMCWFQGEDDLGIPKLNQECFKKWKQLNTGWQVNVLTNETISDYVPEFFDIVENSPQRSLAAKSDLLRILLLSKHGGVWVDASVYPVFPLNDFFCSVVNDVGFFAYRFKPRSKSRETVSWFLCVDKPNHHLINAWKESFVEKFENQRKWKYFTFHEALAELYDSNSQVRFTIDNMVQIDQKIPHSFSMSGRQQQDSYVYKRPKL